MLKTFIFIAKAGKVQGKISKSVRQTFKIDLYYLDLYY